jgi:hypothetical protein
MVKMGDDKVFYQKTKYQPLTDIEINKTLRKVVIISIHNM